MVRRAHDDDVVSLGLGPGDLDRSLDGLGPRVPEEERVEGRVRHHGQQRLDELDVRLRQGDGALDVDDRLRLGNDSGRDVWVGVSERGDSDTRGEVEQLLALLLISL